MDLRLKPEEEALIADLASQKGQTASELLCEVIQNYLQRVVNLSAPEPGSYLVGAQNRSRTEEAFGLPGEYLREQFECYQKRKTEEDLETFFVAGLESGEPITFTAEYLDEKKRRQ